MSPTSTLLPAAVSPLAQIHPLWISLVAIAPAAVWFLRRRGTLPRWGVPVAVLAVAAGIVLGLGIVEIPKLEDLPLQRWVEDVGAAVGAWAYLIVGVLAYLETGAFVGLVAPGETFVILGGVLAGEGTLDYVTLLAVVWLCAFLGDLTSFYLGRRLGRRFLERHGSKVKITPDRLEQVEQFFDKHGGKAIVIGRFIGFVRAIAPFVLGSSGVRARRFVPYSIVGSGLWAALFVTLGFVFWQSLDQLLGWAKQGAFAFGTVIVVVVAAIFLVHWFREAEHRDQAREWLRRAGETRGGRAALAVWRPLSGPARFVWGRITPGDLGLEFTTLVAVIAVGGFAFFGLEGLLDHQGSTHGDRRLLQLFGDVRAGPIEDLARVGLVLASPAVAGLVALLAAVFLGVRHHVGPAVTLAAGAALALGVTALVRSGEDRSPPAGALETIAGSSFPSMVAAGAVVWVAVAVALTPVVRRVPGRIGLTGIVIVFGVALCCAPLVLRTAYLSDVLAGAGLAVALVALVGLAALLVSHLRQNPVG